MYGGHHRRNVSLVPLLLLLLIILVLLAGCCGGSGSGGSRNNNFLGSCVVVAFVPVVPHQRQRQQQPPTTSTSCDQRIQRAGFGCIQLQSHRASSSKQESCDDIREDSYVITDDTVVTNQQLDTPTSRSTTIIATTASSTISTTPTTTTGEKNDQSRIIVLGLLWCIAAISALDRVAMSVALVPMSYEYNNHILSSTGSSSATFNLLTDTTKGLISSVFSIGYGFAIIPAGILISCTSPKMIMTVGILVWSIATIATPYSAESMIYTIVPILCVRSMVGMGEAILIPTIHRLLSVWTTKEQKSSALAFIFSGFHAGTIGAYLLSPYIMDVLTIHHDWRVLFYVYGTCGILILFPWLLFAKDQPTTTATTTTTNSDDDDSTVAMAISWDEALASYRNAPWKEFIQSKGVWGMLLAHSAKNWGLYTLLSWTPTFYAEQYNIGVRDSAWLSVMPSIAGALGGFLAGTLADQSIKNMSTLSMNHEMTTQIRKIFQTVGLLGPAIALAALAYQLPKDAGVAQLYLVVSVGLQSFNAGGFEAGTHDKAGPKWIGMLYSVTSLPSVMGT